MHAYMHAHLHSCIFSHEICYMQQTLPLCYWFHAKTGERGSKLLCAGNWQHEQQDRRDILRRGSQRRTGFACQNPSSQSQQVIDSCQTLGKPIQWITQHSFLHAGTQKAWYAGWILDTSMRGETLTWSQNSIELCRIAGGYVLAALSGSRFWQENNAFKYGARWTDQACVSEEFKGTWTAGMACNQAKLLLETLTKFSLCIFSPWQAVKFAIQQAEGFLAQTAETCSTQWKLRYAGRYLALSFALTAS